MTKQGKRYEGALALVDRARSYPPEEAIALVKQTATAKFDETVEIHLLTSSDPKHADQLIRGVVLMPHGLGKPVRVLVFAQAGVAQAAKEAGADYVGADELIQQIEGGWVEFDTAIATPDMMGKIGRLGRVLGRRGLMPNPRTGTVIQPQDVGRAVGDAKKGRVEYRMDRTAILHAPIGKASFEVKALFENLATLMEAVLRARPATVKGQFIRTAYLKTTMGPSVPLDLPSLQVLKVE
ncbi:MAG: 50S ribosomal protein L1 [Chloroflexi bacterium]|nr:50S ribosomal protein L1 [Chloroflexota bacterium]